MKKLFSSLSVVLPAYNEADNIAWVIKEVEEFCEANVGDYEIIIVNDGSVDQTAAVVSRQSARNSRIRMINHDRNLGYGQTVWDGFRRASKEWLFLIDADRQFRISELLAWRAELGRYDVMVGWRKKRRDHLVRRLNTWVWNKLVYLTVGLPLRDVDCAFKLIRRSTLQGLAIRSTGAVFSAELLRSLVDRRVKLVERPVNHYPRLAGQASGARLKVIIKGLIELIILTYRLRFNKGQ